MKLEVISSSFLPGEFSFKQPKPEVPVQIQKSKSQTNPVTYYLHFGDY
jgi:hypothetical protein